MKILYAIQGTGNGHISRAREIIPLLKQYVDVDILISGTQSDVKLNDEILYNKYGLSFTFGKNGGIDFLNTFIKLKPFNLIKDILTIPVENYTLIINDFEPITALACKIKNINNTISLSHQASFLSKKTPRPLIKNRFSEFVFKHYAPCEDNIGFHFKKYDDFIYTPVIRSEIRNLNPKNKKHYTVYLPAYSDEFLLPYLTKIKNVKFEVFSKHTKNNIIIDNVNIKPINNEFFIKSLENCEGLITNGGFESPAEALYLGKKVMSIPMHNQYEQLCNATALQDIGGVMVEKIDSEFTLKLNNFIDTENNINIDFPDITIDIIRNILHSIY